VSTTVVDAQELEALGREIADTRRRIRELEQAQTDHFFDADREARISRLREKLAGLEGRYDELRRAAEEAVAAERARVEAEKAAARPALEAKRASQRKEMQAALLRAEEALSALVDAVRDAMELDTRLNVLAAALDEREPLRTAATIGERVGRRLRDVGIRDTVAFGLMGSEPLAQPVAQPSPRAADRGSTSAVAKRATKRQSAGQRTRVREG
jgi:hypothetical protein